MADLMRQAREQFEACMMTQTTHGNEHVLMRFGRCDERYLSPLTSSMWAAWQAALRTMPEWHPIETAPRDGTRILLWDAERAEAVFGRWLDDGTGDFAPMTHWAPEVAGPTSARPQGVKDAP